MTAGEAVGRGLPNPALWVWKMLKTRRGAQFCSVAGFFLGWQFLNEQMGGTRVLGAVVIFAGILVIAFFG